MNAPGWTPGRSSSSVNQAPVRHASWTWYNSKAAVAHPIAHLPFQFLHNEHFHRYDPFEKPTKEIQVDGKSYDVELRDFNFTPLREGDPSISISFVREIFRAAGGFILLYDVNSYDSFQHITDYAYLFILDNRRVWAKEEPDPETAKLPPVWVDWRPRTLEDGIFYPCGQQRFGCVLVGTKLDLARQEREVGKDVAEAWADRYGMKHFELDTYSQEPINEIVQVVIKSSLREHKRDLQGLEAEVMRLKAVGGPGNEVEEPQDGSQKGAWGKFRNTLKKAVP